MFFLRHGTIYAQAALQTIDPFKCFSASSKSSSPISFKESHTSNNIAALPTWRPSTSLSVTSGSPRSTRSRSVNKEDTDCYLVTPQKQNSLSNELLNRLVRNTFSNIRTAAQNLHTARESTNDEMEDMHAPRSYTVLIRRSSEASMMMRNVTQQKHKIIELQY